MNLRTLSQSDMNIWQNVQMEDGSFTYVGVLPFCYKTSDLSMFSFLKACRHFFPYLLGAVVLGECYDGSGSKSVKQSPAAMVSY